VRRGIAVDDGSAAADAGGEGGLRESLEDGRRNLRGRDVVGIELGEGEEVAAGFVEDLLVGGVGLEQR